MSIATIVATGGFLTACVAVLISVYGALRAVHAHHETLATETVVQLYGHFQTLSDLRMANWELSHLFELPSNYDEVSRSLAVALGPLSEARQEELLLKERAIALRIFDLFEQVLYQKTTADRYHDPARREFLQSVLDYFTGRWLRNPRLVHLWRTAMSESYETATIAYYDRHVVDAIVAPEVLRLDAAGPYVDES